MMKTQLSIKCPKCGARLKIAVKTDADFQKLSLACPVCKVKSPLSMYGCIDNPVPTPPIYQNPDNLYSSKTSYEVPSTGRGNGHSSRYESINLGNPAGGATCYENINYGYDSFGNRNDFDKTTVDPIEQIGILRSSNGMMYPLQNGRNVIGRKAGSSSASIQLDMGGKMRLGREHLNIDVSGNPISGYLYVVSLVKEHCNYTAVNGVELKFGDSVYLKSGDRISLPDIDIIFEIPQR